MDIEKIKNIVNCIADRYYFNFDFIVEPKYIKITFIETKHSHIRPDQYFEMIEEIIYNEYIINFKTKLSNSEIFIYNKS